jgi:hypothetical protein
MSLLTTLQQQHASISAVAPLTQAITLKLAGWQAAIGQTAAWRQALAHAQSQGWSNGTTMTLDRQSLINTVTSGAPLEASFLLNMLWGYGTGRGRGRSAVSKMLQTPGLTTILTQARADLGAGDDRGAFLAYSSFQGMGMSFATKQLYFESRAARSTGYLPIFDDRVAQELFRLALDPADQWLCHALSHGRGGSWASYDAYTRNLRALAGGLSPAVTVEQLEYWLFL